MFLTVGLGSLPLAAAAAAPLDFGLFTHSVPLWLLLVVLALASTLMPFVLMNRYQPHVSASEAGVIYGAEPVLASVLALFLPAILSSLAGIVYDNERLTLRLLLGALLVTFAAILVRGRAADSALPSLDSPAPRHADD